MLIIVPATLALSDQALRTVVEAWGSDSVRLMVFGLALLMGSNVVRHWFASSQTKTQGEVLHALKEASFTPSQGQPARPVRPLSSIPEYSTRG